jgi:hypothetical protein
MYEIGKANQNTPAVGAVSPGGVVFVNSSALSTGEWSGVLSSDFPAAVATLISNPTAKVADAYTGFGDNAIATELYGTLIFNKHANFESIFYCQNAGGVNATVKAELYKVGQATPKVTLTSSSLEVGRGVKWDIADDSAVQTQWPGQKGEYGYVKFSSTEKIACVVDNQRMADPYVQSLFNAVPATGFSSTDLRIPLIFHGHGSSSDNTNKGTKWNSGINLVNPGTTEANVTVKFTALTTDYTSSCTVKIAAGGSETWYAPEVGGPGNFTCSGGALTWPNPSGKVYSYGSAVVNSDQPVLALANGNRYDTGNALGAGYSSQGASPNSATTKVACPLVFNKDTKTDWITGVQVANVGEVATNVSFTMVKANTDPASAGSTATLSGGAYDNVPAGGSATAYMPENTSALTSFEGVVFVKSSAEGSKITASSSSTNYTTLGAAALYDCINY